MSISSALLFTAASSDSSSATQISLPVNVVVNNPDASGLTGPTHVISSAPATFTITPPLPATVAPVSPGAQTNTEGAVISGATAVTITSNDPDATSFSDLVGAVHTLPPGLSINPATGVITGTIGAFAAQNSPYTVTISELDDGVTGSVQFKWTVNQALLVINNPGNQTNVEDAVLSGATALTITSPNADPNSFTATGLPPGLTISAAGVISGTIAPNTAQNSPYTVKVSATHDGTPGSITFTWTVTPLPPTLTNPGPQLNSPGDTVSLTINATGADANTFTDVSKGVHTLPPGLTISPAGVITGILNQQDGGVYPVVISATHDGAVGSTSFTWTVPSLANPAHQVDNPLDHVSLQLTSTNFNSFTDNGTLPPGLTVSNTGLISGIIASSDLNTYAVSITATYQTITKTINFNWLVTTHSIVTTVVLGTDGSLLQFGPTGSDQQLSPAGTMKAVSTVVDVNGVTAVYAITTGLAGPQYLNTLWENYNGAWSERSTGSFKQISATTDQNGAAVVFGVLTDDSLWEEPVAFGLNTGWVELSPAGTIQSISAVTDKSGEEWCYAIVTTGNNLWLHGPAFPSGWQQLSNGSFQQVSAGLNSSGQAVSYSVLTGGQVWEQNPAFGAPGLNSGFRQLSAIGGLPSTFQSVQAAGPDAMFGIAADGTVWEHSPSGNQQISPILLASQLSATATPSGTDEVFMTLIDSSFWEYSPTLPGDFLELLDGGAASSSTPP